MRRLPALLLTSTLLATVSVAPIFAQAGPPPSPPAAPSTAPNETPPPVTDPATPPAQAAPSQAARDKAMADRRRIDAADRDAMFSAHLAALHAGLTLTPDQEGKWPAVEQAVRGFVKMRADLRDRHADMRQDRDVDADPVAEFQAFAQNQLERGQALKALADASAPLYASLDADQKRRLPMLLHDLVPGRGPLSALVDRLDTTVRHDPDDARTEGEMDRPDPAGDRMADRDRGEQPDQGMDREDQRPDRHRGDMRPMPRGHALDQGRGDDDRQGRGDRMYGREPDNAERGWTHRGWAHGPNRDPDDAQDDWSGDERSN